MRFLDVVFPAYHQLIQEIDTLLLGKRNSIFFSIKVNPCSLHIIGTTLVHSTSNIPGSPIHHRMLPTIVLRVDIPINTPVKIAMQSTLHGTLSGSVNPHRSWMRSFWRSSDDIST